MGWLNSLFRKREVLNFESLKELETYFLEFIKPSVESANKVKKGLWEEFKYKLVELNEESEKLRCAELRNPDIEEKLKDFMTGNRTNYLSQMNFFITGLPELDDNFCERFNEKLAVFAEKTKKSNLILREFFAHEVRAVSAKIADLTKIVANIKTAEKKVEKINKILRRMKFYYEKENELEVLKQKNLEHKISSFEFEIKTITQEKENLETSEEYKNHLGLLKKEEELLEGLREVKERILNLIASVFRVLKKYERAALKHQGLIHGYLKSTVDTFLLDGENKILEILENAGNIELNDKDKTKLDKSIGNFDEKQLNKLRKECLEKDKIHNSLVKKIKEEKINVRLSELNKNVKKKEEQLKELREEQEENNKKIERTSKESEELLIELKQEVEEYCYSKINFLNNRNL